MRNSNGISAFGTCRRNPDSRNWNWARIQAECERRAAEEEAFIKEVNARIEAGEDVDIDEPHAGLLKSSDIEDDDCNDYIEEDTDSEIKTSVTDNSGDIEDNDNVVGNDTLEDIEEINDYESDDSETMEADYTHVTSYDKSAYTNYFYEIM